jgi:hypothetical protein
MFTNSCPYAHIFNIQEKWTRSACIHTERSMSLTEMCKEQNIVYNVIYLRKRWVLCVYIHTCMQNYMYICKNILGKMIPRISPK